MLSYRTSAFKIPNKFSHWSWGKFSVPNFSPGLYYKFIIGGIAFLLQSSYIIRMFPLKIPHNDMHYNILIANSKRIRPNTQIKNVTSWNHDSMTAFCQCLMLRSFIRNHEIVVMHNICISRDGNFPCIIMVDYSATFVSLQNKIWMYYTHNRIIPCSTYV